MTVDRTKEKEGDQMAPRHQILVKRLVTLSNPKHEHKIMIYKELVNTYSQNTRRTLYGSISLVYKSMEMENKRIRCWHNLDFVYGYRSYPNKIKLWLYLIL